jgi:hypothetical protein
MIPKRGIRISEKIMRKEHVRDVTDSILVDQLEGAARAFEGAT